MKVTQEESDSLKLTGSKGQGPILCFRGGPCHCGLFLGLPANLGIANKEAKSTDGTPSVRATSPIRITETAQSDGGTAREEQATTRRAFEVFKDMLARKELAQLLSGK